MSNKDIDYQARLAVEHMSASNCKECKWYKYGKIDQVCLFHSAPIDECNVVKLVGKFNDFNRNKC